jgi:tRNA A58 N-methylase Trm61
MTKHKAMGHLTEAQYKIIADRMIEEHRKYGDRLRPGHWADVAARKVASHMADFKEGEGQPIYTKDAELIQMLVDALRNLRDIHEFRVGREPLTGTDELAAAAAAGFKPSYP